MVLSADGIPGMSHDELKEQEAKAHVRAVCVEILDAAVQGSNLPIEVSIPIIKTITSEVCDNMIREGKFDNHLDGWSKEADAYAEMIKEAISERRKELLNGND